MKAQIELIQQQCLSFRQRIFEMTIRAQKGHIPSCFSMAEVLCTLFYGGFINLNKENINDEHRDRLIISKGHAAMAIYPFLCDLGIYSKEELDKFTQQDGAFRFYADPSIKGVEAVSGSLGNGLGVACGLAYSIKCDRKNQNVFTVVGDGELYEGSVWETFMFGAHHNLTNLVLIIDRNKLCILDETENCVKIDPIDSKLSSFGWEVQSVDGHDIASLIGAFQHALRSERTLPQVIIADTIKGKGISFMENKPLWHNRMPKGAELNQAINELGIKG